MATAQSTQRRRVRVWFGNHAIADYTAAPELADRYAAAMSRRFGGLRISSEPVPLTVPANASPADRTGS